MLLASTPARNLPRLFVLVATELSQVVVRETAAWTGQGACDLANGGATNGFNGAWDKTIEMEKFLSTKDSSLFEQLIGMFVNKKRQYSSALIPLLLGQSTAIHQHEQQQYKTQQTKKKVLVDLTLVRSDVLVEVSAIRADVNHIAHQ